MDSSELKATLGGPYVNVLLGTILSGAFVVLFGLFYSMRQAPLPPYAPQLTKDNWPYVGAVKFFSKRWDFFQTNRLKTTTGAFSFFLGKYPVIGLSGTEDRQQFFDHKNLNFDEGYAVLFGLAPTLEDFGKEVSEYSNADGSQKTSISTFGAKFHNRMNRALRAENIAINFPRMIENLREEVDRIASTSRPVINPFNDVYRMVFRLTVRILGCNDFADDVNQSQKVAGLLDLVENSTTPTTIITPWWFPTISRFRRTWAGIRLYTMVQGIAKARRRTGKRAGDMLQTLLDADEGIDFIIRFMMSSFFAGKHNSSLNAAYMLCHLAASPHWMAKVRKEIADKLSYYAQKSEGTSEEKLLQIPVEVWETGFPTLEICLKETIRLSLAGTAFRWSSAKEPITLSDGKNAIPPGAFVTYPFADIHQDPKVYSEPEAWDPSRFLPGRNEGSKTRHAFVGWGSGRHPCLGMRFAKFEIFLVTSMLLERFDFTLQDEAGNPLDEVFPYNINAPTAQRPRQEMFLKCQPKKPV